MYLSRRLVHQLVLALAVTCAFGAAARPLPIRSSTSPPPPVPLPPTVAVQPLGAVEPSAVEAAKAAVESLYRVEVVVLPGRELPRSAYYEPRRRYRAALLLDDLGARTDARYAKVIGITAADISDTKDEYYDWGILGLGSVGGRSCVVSTFRLRRGGATQAMFVERLSKAVDHELGHTFGLEHCSTSECLMEDAGGTVTTLDREKLDLCDSCRGSLVGKVALRGGDRLAGGHERPRWPSTSS